MLHLMPSLVPYLIARLSRMTGVLVAVGKPCEFVVEIVEFAGLEVGSRGSVALN